MEKTKVTCTHCKHSWKTVSKTALVTCAGCGLKTKTKKEKKS